VSRMDDDDMGPKERAHLQRWFSSKYGLTSSEVGRLLAHPDVHGLQGRLEHWREAHGLPAENSGLSRGKLMEMVDADLRSHGVKVDDRAALAKRAVSLRATVQDRAAYALNWPLSAVQSMSLQSLRTAVQHVDAGLAEAISDEIQSGRYITQKKRPSGKRGTIKADMNWIGQPPTAEASARYETERADIIARNEGRPSMPPGTKRG
jgi:hypothetical protein